MKKQTEDCGNKLQIDIYILIYIYIHIQNALQSTKYLYVIYLIKIAQTDVAIVLPILLIKLEKFNDIFKTFLPEVVFLGIESR